jgi:hypothetical protein
MADVIVMPTARPGIDAILTPELTPAKMPLQRETMLPPALRWIESWVDEPTVLLPDVPDLEAAVASLAPLATAARAELTPADPAEVIAFFKAFADRHRLDLPDVYALELDAETLADVPRVALREAFKELWRTWKYRRLPTVGDIMPIARRELEEGRAWRLRRLIETELKLKTARMRAHWDSEARERHARDLAEERHRTSDVTARQAETTSDAVPQGPIPSDRQRRHREHREAAKHVAETLAERRRLTAERERQATDPDNHSVPAVSGGEDCPARPTDNRSLDDGLPVDSAASSMLVTGLSMPESSAADTTMTRSTCLGDPSSEAGATIDRPQCPTSERTRYWDLKAGRFRRHRLAHARSAWPIRQDHNSFRACLHLPADRSNQHPQSAPLGPIPWVQEGDRQPRMVPSAAPGANELPGTAGPSGNLLASQVSLISFGATGTTWPRPVMKAATSPRAISSASMHQPLRIPTQDAHAGAEKRGGGRRHGGGLDTGRLCRRAKRTFFITGRTTGPLRCRALVRPCGSRPFARDPPGTWSPALLGPPARRGG